MARRKTLTPHTAEETAALDQLLLELEATIEDLKGNMTEETNRRLMVQFSYAIEAVKGIRDTGVWVR